MTSSMTLRDIRIESLKGSTGVDSSFKEGFNDRDNFDESLNKNSRIFDAESLMTNESAIQKSIKSAEIRYANNGLDLR